MKLFRAHVSTACVRACYQMEYTLKGVRVVYKHEVYFGLKADSSHQFGYLAIYMASENSD